MTGAGLLWLRPGARGRVFQAGLLYAIASLIVFTLWDQYGVGWAMFSYFSILAASIVPLACMIPATIVNTGRLSNRQCVLAGILMAAAPLAW